MVIVDVIATIWTGIGDVIATIWTGIGDVIATVWTGIGEGMVTGLIVGGVFLWWDTCKAKMERRRPGKLPRPNGDRI